MTPVHSEDRYRPPGAELFESSDPSPVPARPELRRYQRSRRALLGVLALLLLVSLLRFFSLAGDPRALFVHAALNVAVPALGFALILRRRLEGYLVEAPQPGRYGVAVGFALLLTAAVLAAYTARGFFGPLVAALDHGKPHTH
jgi:hypothetical protein